MNIKFYLKTSLIMLAGSIFLHNCKDDELPSGHCNKYYILNQDYIDNLLFDYEHTDTLLYKRTINNVVKDTLVFVKKKSYHDTLHFYNQDVAGDEACKGPGEGEFTRERIGWDYSSQYDTIVFNIQVVASGEGNGDDYLLVSISKKFNMASSFGSSIGNYGAQPINPYKTSEKIYDHTWWTFLLNKISFTDYGTRDFTDWVKLDWKHFYNIKYGFVEISKSDRTEVWEFIP